MGSEPVMGGSEPVMGGSEPVMGQDAKEDKDKAIDEEPEQL